MEQVRARSFGSVAADYDRYRPGPSPEAVRWVLGSDRCATALDLAAGTGALTRRLTECADSVFAVEPDDRMRAVLSARSPEVIALAGTGEEIPLRDAAVDAVLVSAAWHWFDPDRAVPEIARVLRPGGVLGILGSGMDTSVPWVERFSQLRRLSPSEERRGRRRSEVVLPDGAPFSTPERAEFHWNREMSRRDLVRLLGTYSGVITAAQDDRERMFREAERYLHDLGYVSDTELIDMPHRTRCLRAYRLP